MINVNKQIFLFNSFSVSFHSLCHSVDFVSYIFSFGKTENFGVYAAERLRQRGKNKTKSNVHKKMRTHLLCMKKGWSSVAKNRTKKWQQQIEDLDITPLGSLPKNVIHKFKVSLDEKSNLKLLKGKILRVNNFVLFIF